MKMHEHIHKKLRVAKIRGSVFYERVTGQTNVLKNKREERQSTFLHNIVGGHTAFIHKLLRKSNKPSRYPGLTLEFLLRFPVVRITQKLLVQRVFHSPILCAAYDLTKLTINYFKNVQTHNSLTTPSQWFYEHYSMLGMADKKFFPVTEQKSSVYQFNQRAHLSGREQPIALSESRPSLHLQTDARSFRPTSIVHTTHSDSGVFSLAVRSPHMFAASERNTDGDHSVTSQLRDLRSSSNVVNHVLRVTSRTGEVATNFIKNTTRQRLQTGPRLQRALARRSVDTDLTTTANILKHVWYSANDVARRPFTQQQRAEQAKNERERRWGDEPNLKHKQQRNVSTSLEKEQASVLNSPASIPVRPALPQGITERPGITGLPDLDTLTNEVMHKIEQRLTTERERRGIFS